MKRIGICTLYYQNRNYGANLQAYALQRILQTMDNEVRVVPYYYKTWIYRILSIIKHSLERKDSVNYLIKERNRAVDRFNSSIPHSKVYYSNTIHKANKEYDCFIAGSDQVWNPNWINPYMALAFVAPSKRTASYAASTGKITLNDEQADRLKPVLERTQFISIREKESIPALQALTDKPIQYVLDPTMLLKREQWDEICADRMVEGKYMFCYFLGNNRNLRKVTKEYAALQNLQLVTLPYLNGKYRSVDDGFGDVQLYDVSPNQFLSLIKYASFIMTDSFHATVFSHLYERAFVVSGGGKDEMGCRMKSLTELFGTEDRYIPEHDDVSVEKLSVLPEGPLKLNWINYEEMRQKSFEFLQRVVSDD